VGAAILPLDTVMPPGGRRSSCPRDPPGVGLLILSSHGDAQDFHLVAVILVGIRPILEGERSLRRILCRSFEPDERLEFLIHGIHIARIRVRQGRALLTLEPFPFRGQPAGQFRGCDGALKRVEMRRDTDPDGLEFRLGELALPSSGDHASLMQIVAEPGLAELVPSSNMIDRAWIWFGNWLTSSFVRRSIALRA